MLNEKQRRLFLGFLADEIGHGGLTMVSKELEVDIKTVGKSRSDYRNLKEENREDNLITRRFRRKGSGRRKSEELNPLLLDGIKRVLGWNSDRDNIFDWTNQSLRDISEQCNKIGLKVTHMLVGRMLSSPTTEHIVFRKNKLFGRPCPEGGEQIKCIENAIQVCVASGNPVISMTKANYWDKKFVENQFKGQKLLKDCRGEIDSPDYIDLNIF